MQDSPEKERKREALPVGKEVDLIGGIVGDVVVEVVVEEEAGALGAVAGLEVEVPAVGGVVGGEGEGIAVHWGEGEEG